MTIGAVLNIDEDTMSGIFSLVSAVLQIGNLEFVASADGESVNLTPNDKKVAAKIAKLLGVWLTSPVEASLT